jgi:hypothetical protein
MRQLYRRILALCTFTALGHSAFAGMEPIPPAAKTVIERVHRAAVAKDFDSLRKYMVPEFSWSFGGDASAEQAIEAWKKQPGYLRQLARVTKLKCIYRKDRYVECPVGAGTNFRAGFKATDGKWRMEYFVEGD